MKTTKAASTATKKAETKPQRITVPKGKIAVFLDEKLGKLMQELCEIADVEPEQWLNDRVSREILENGIHSSWAIRWENGKLNKLVTSGILDDFRYDYDFSPHGWEDTCEKLAEVIEREQRKAGKLQTVTITKIPNGSAA